MSIGYCQWRLGKGVDICMSHELSRVDVWVSGEHVPSSYQQDPYLNTKVLVLAARYIKPPRYPTESQLNSTSTNLSTPTVPNINYFSSLQHTIISIMKAVYYGAIAAALCSKLSFGAPTP